MKRLLSLVIWGLGALWAMAQNPRLYTIQHGLNTSNFKSVYIDSYGMVWLSGSRLLARFDGTRFESLPIVDKATGNPLFSQGKGVRECGDDCYWVYTSNGLFVLHARTNTFERIMLSSQEDSVHGYSVNAVSDYVLPGHVFVTTDGFGAYVYNVAARQVNQKASEDIIRAIGSEFIVHSLIDNHRYLWAYTINRRLVCVALDSMQQRQVEVDADAEMRLQNSWMHDMEECGDKLYFATTQGLLCYDAVTNRVSVVRGLDGTVNALMLNHEGKIYVGTDSYGIWVLDPTTNALSRYQNLAVPFDLRYAKVTDLVEDRDGSLVVEVMQKGLLIVPARRSVFSYHAFSPEGNGTNTSCVTSMAFDGMGRCWIGTDGCGVFVADRLGVAARELSEGLRSKLVQSVVVDKRGTVWCGSYGGGVQRMEGHAEGLWTLGEADWLMPLANELVTHLCYDEKEDVIYVSTNGHGIYRIDPVAGEVVEYNYEALKNRWLVMSFVDSEGTLWSCTAVGLNYYNPRTGRQGELECKGQKFIEVVDVDQCGDNVLFASNKGLYLYNLKSHAIDIVGKSAGLLSEDIRSIEVKDGFIWVATAKGIASIDSKTHAIRNYTSFSGYSMGEFHRNAAVLSPDGTILLGGDNGVVSFMPHDIQGRKSKVGELYFTALQIGTESVDDANEEVLDAAILYAKKIHLSHSKNSFAITFSVPEFADPERIHYDYLLEGFEEQWHTNVGLPQAAYWSLPWGQYKLRVRAYFEDCPEGATERSIGVVVDAPWYWSPTAIVVYVLLLLVVGYFFYHSWKERKEQRLQIKKVKDEEEMREAKLRMFTSITHELKSPLMMVESPLKELMATDTDERRMGLYVVMRRNCQRMLDVVKQITDIRKIDAGQFELKLEEHDYVAYANQVFEQFKGVAAVKNISFVVEHHEEVLPMFFDETHFEKIISNLLSNAFKFTPAGGRVIVRSGVVGGNVELCFYNSGSHFDEEDRLHLYERFYQGSAGNNASGSGIGLNLVFELVKLHNGKIEAKNIDPDGVEFILLFPFFNPDLGLRGGNKTTVLVVDDDKEVVEFVKSQLEDDCRVLVAFSGNQGWKQVVQQRPDVVVTDYKMPDGDGVELCLRVKSNPETDNTPVIMLTGEGNESLQLHSLNIQVDHYLEKPVSMTMLRSAIAQVLRVREKMRNKIQRMDIGANYHGLEVASVEEKLFERIDRSIKAHLDDNAYSVQQLAEDVGMSRVHLARKMKERYGMTPSQFIKSFRLKQAAYILVNYDLNVSEVMYRVVFSNHSHFSSAFHEYFSMSPTEFVAYYSDPAHEGVLKKLLE